MNSKETNPGSDKKYYDMLIDLSYLESYNLEVCSEIGRGGFGVVYKCRNKLKTRKYALKVLFSTAFPEIISSELAFLRILNENPSIPKLIQAFQHDCKVHILMEYKKNNRFITFFDTLPIIEIKFYLYSLVQSLIALHNYGIIHRDIKPGNFLYSIKLRSGVLIDFGLSEIESNFKKKIVSFQKNELNPDDISYKLLQNKLKDYEFILENEKLVGRNKIGTESYMALEALLFKENQGFEVDMWSVGVILFQILTGKYSMFNNLVFVKKISYKPRKYNHLISFILELSLIFGTEKLSNILDKYGYEVEFPDDFPKEKPCWKEFIKRTDGGGDVLNLLEKLLELDPEKRITGSDALNHGFFDEINKK